MLGALPAFVCSTFQSELGFVPLVELGGYCMCNGANDWDALTLLAERIAAKLGGWVIVRPHNVEIPSLPYGVSLLDDGVREVVARDTAGYFGARIDDADFVRQYRDFVPEERYWLIDARLSPASWVRK